MAGVAAAAAAAAAAGGSGSSSCVADGDCSSGASSLPFYELAGGQLGLEASQLRVEAIEQVDLSAVPQLQRRAFLRGREQHWLLELEPYCNIIAATAPGGRPPVCGCSYRKQIMRLYPVAIDLRQLTAE